jgi:hypothetical protein
MPTLMCPGAPLDRRLDIRVTCRSDLAAVAFTARTVARRDEVSMPASQCTNKPFEIWPVRTQ